MQRKENTTYQSHRNQSYEAIRHHCLKNRSKWEDPEFPATDATLFFSRAPPRPFVWKRPEEITPNAKLFVGGASRFDITQGMLGDCWLLAAVASLSLHENMLYQVIPADQDFEAGIVRFRFWQYGKWTEVCVDDRLPTYNNKLVFLHSAEQTEFWSALLEKAYAKLHGSYEALKGGQTSEAMEDFTGGVTETFDLAKVPDDFFKIMRKADARCSLMGCSVDAKPNEIEAKLDNGLIKGHAYSITAVKKVSVRGRDVQLIRVRNPWGNEREWKGAWSDTSKEWRLLSEDQKHEIGLVFKDDGEFWMSYEDFKTNFSKVEICNLGPDSVTEGDGMRWEARDEPASWHRSVTAGGCRNFINTFATNPQFRVKLEDPDDDDELDNCTLVVSLMQKNRRSKKSSTTGGGNLTIGFSIYKYAAGYGERLPREFFERTASTARSPSFINAREVTGRYSLPPDEYVIIPCTFNPNEEGDFLLRLFSEKPHESSGMDIKNALVAPKIRRSVPDSEMEAKFKEFFNRIAGDDNCIDAFELRSVLESATKQEMEGKAFNIETCRSLVSLMDADKTGKLDCKEFIDLWTYVMQLKKAFSHHDRDKSGALSTVELRTALQMIGIMVSTPVLAAICSRFSSKKDGISLDDFMQISSRLRTAFETLHGIQKKGSPHVDSHTFLMTCAMI